MNLQFLLDACCAQLKNFGGVQVPTYPDFTIPPWLHPDFVFRSFGDESRNLFAIQPKLRCCWNKTDKTRTTPFVVWYQKPFNLDWLQEISSFVVNIFEDVSKKKDPKNELWDGNTSALIQVRGTEFSEDFFQPKGCVWEISCNSLPIGQVLVLSELMDSPLPRPVGFAQIDVDPLLFLLDVFFPGTDNSGLEEFLSWKVRESRSIFCNRDCNNDGCVSQIFKLSEEFIEKESWFEAYRCVLEGYSFFRAPFQNLSNKCLLFSDFEKKMKPSLKKIITIFNKMREK